MLACCLWQLGMDMDSSTYGVILQLSFRQEREREREIERWHWGRTREREIAEIAEDLRGRETEWTWETRGRERGRPWKWKMNNRVLNREELMWRTTTTKQIYAQPNYRRNCSDCASHIVCTHTDRSVLNVHTYCMSYLVEVLSCVASYHSYLCCIQGMG